jgi:hypothetical protein
MEPLKCFQPTGEEPGAEAARRRLASLDDAALVCADCGYPITSAALRVRVGGEHEHVGVNPTGWSYRFGCFAGAPGCRSEGVPSKQATWFPGYWWHIQVCGGCGVHLGWLFFADDPERSQFYGLILDRLVEVGSVDSGPAQ